MLRRTGFARRIYTPPPAAPLRALARPVTGITMSAMVVAFPKENAIQHAGYMDLVRDLPCARCWRPPRSQFCHSDLGKGLGIKTDCRLGWPGCAVCHHLVGSTGILGREERRHVEAEYSASTRKWIIAQGLWPARLPLWEETTP